MVRLLGWIVLLSCAFGLGYYVGRHPSGEVTTTLATLSDDLVQSTLRIERNVRFKQGLLDAKSRVVQAKSELLDKNYGQASLRLDEARGDLARAEQAERRDDDPARIRSIREQLYTVQEDVKAGKPGARTKLDKIERDLDGLIALHR